jgi:Sister chromatid cohesion protein Dcc1
VCRRCLKQEGGWLGHHVLRRLCAPSAAPEAGERPGGSRGAILCADLTSDSAAPAPEPLPAGAALAFDRAAVAKELARLALIRRARDAKVSVDTPGGSLDYGAVLRDWRELMPAPRHWPAPHGSDSGGRAADLNSDDEQAAFAAALAGIALVDSDGAGARRLTVVAEEALPMEARARFAALFALKPCWAGQELAPYLPRAFDAACRGPAELLLAHTRACRAAADAPPVYCAR